MRKEYEKITISEIEKVVADLFNKNLEKDDTPYLVANPLTEEEIQEVISRPESGYNKILTGYWYAIQGSIKVNTGAGGAKSFYKTFLQEGLDEDLIQEIIFVYVNDAYYPLSCLNVKKVNE